MRNCEIDLTLGRWLRIWWLFHWRIAAGAFVIGVLLLQIGLEEAAAQKACLWAAPWLFLLWSLAVMHMLLHKRYQGFRLALVSEGSPVPAAPGRVLSVWWLYAWRNAVGLLLLSLPQGIAIASDGRYTNHNSAWRVLDVFWTFAVMYVALRKRYRNFRIMLMPA